VGCGPIHRRVLVVNLTVPCFLMSGPCAAAPRAALRHGLAGFFPKPFRLTEMVKALARLALRTDLP
jgi:hypothetical protein